MKITQVPAPLSTPVYANARVPLLLPECVALHGSQRPFSSSAHLGKDQRPIGHHVSEPKNAFLAAAPQLQALCQVPYVVDPHNLHRYGSRSVLTTSHSPIISNDIHGQIISFHRFTQKS